MLKLLKITCFLLACTSLLCGYSPAKSAREFPSATAKKLVKGEKLFPFKGTYPNLKKIDFTESRRDAVKFTLSGKYPELETVSIHLEKTNFTVVLSGEIPKLHQINLTTKRGVIALDLRNHQNKSGKINISTWSGNVYLILDPWQPIRIQTNQYKSKTHNNLKFKRKSLKWLSNKYEYTSKPFDSKGKFLQINIHVRQDAHIYFKNEL